MTEKLKHVIQTVKIELNKNPAYIIVGELCDGIKNVINDNDKVQSYYDFLEECNGASCGAIDFWSLEELYRKQFKVTNLTDGEEAWICIGQILYEPLVLNKNNSMVYRFYRDNEDDSSGECFGYLDEFLMDYVFGKKYSEIIPDAENDEWYQLLQKLKLF